MASARSNAATHSHSISPDTSSITNSHLGSGSSAGDLVPFSTLAGNVTPSSLRIRPRGSYRARKGFAGYVTDFFHFAAHDVFGFHAVAADSRRPGSGMFGIAFRALSRYTQERPVGLDGFVALLDGSEQPFQLPRPLPRREEHVLARNETERMIRHRNLSCRRSIPPPRLQRYEQDNEKDCRQFTHRIDCYPQSNTSPARTYGRLGWINDSDREPKSRIRISTCIVESTVRCRLAEGKSASEL